MAKDLGIKYNAKLIEVEENIKKLGTLDIKTGIYTDAVREIREVALEEVSDIGIQYDKADSNIFLYDSIASVYSKAISKLDKINTHITSEYNDYYKINAEYKELTSKLEDVDSSNIKMLVNRVYILLTNMKETSTIDFESERKIVENIYELVYKFMKLESAYSHNNSLLKKIKIDESDITYVSKLIKEEISSLGLNEENKEIFDVYRALDKEGLGSGHLLDEDLIALLAVSGNGDLIKGIGMKFFDKANFYIDAKHQLSDVEKQREVTKDRIVELKKDNKKIFFRALKRRTLLFIDVGLVSAVLTGGYYVLRNKAQEPLYKTVTTTYDSNKDETVPVEEYLPETEDSVILTEYSPWKGPGFLTSQYKRNICTYDLSSVEGQFEDLEDYLDKDLRKDIRGDADREIIDDKPKDKYSKDKYVVTKVEQDKDDQKMKTDVQQLIISTLLLLYGTLKVNHLFFNKISNTKLKVLKEKRKNNKLEIKENSQFLLENKEKLNELTDKIFTMKNDLEKEYQELPVTLQRDKKVKQKIHSIDGFCEKKDS